MVTALPPLLPIILPTAFFLPQQPLPPLLLSTLLLCIRRPLPSSISLKILSQAACLRSLPQPKTLTPLFLRARVPKVNKIHERPNLLKQPWLTTIPTTTSTPTHLLFRARVPKVNKTHNRFNLLKHPWLTTIPGTDHGASIMEATSYTPETIHKSHNIHPPAGESLGDQIGPHPSGDIYNNNPYPPPFKRLEEQAASRTSGEKQQHDRTSIPGKYNIFPCNTCTTERSLTREQDLVEEGSNIQAEQTETSTNLKPSKQFTDSHKASQAEPTTQPADSNLELEQSNTNDEESKSDGEVSINTAIQAGKEPSTMPETKPLSKKAKIKRMKKARKRRFRGKKHHASTTSQDTASQSDTETDSDSEDGEARASQVQFETSHLASTFEASPEPSNAIKESQGRQRPSNILIQQGQDLVREDPETTTTPTLTASPEDVPSSTTTVLATHGDDALTCSSSRGMGLSPDKPNPASGDLIIQTPPGFVWELTKVSFPCAKMDCRRACNPWDGQSVICPKCGPYSLIRYCGRDHLREDVSQHWNHCDKYSFQHPCVPGSVPPEVLSGPPQLPCRHRWDSPERHRQAMLFSTARRDDGDYVLFAEWPLATAAGGDPGSSGAVVRIGCSSRFGGTIPWRGIGSAECWRSAFSRLSRCNPSLASCSVLCATASAFGASGLWRLTTCCDPRFVWSMASTSSRPSRDSTMPMRRSGLVSTLVPVKTQPT